MIKVLYAEDEPAIAEVVRSFLQANAPECRLEVVPDGRTCLQRMRAGGYDVLLVDLVLPDINGLRIIGELAGRNDPTPVIMISGHGQNELAVKAVRAGAVDCIDKSSPQFLQVADIIRHAHARHRQRLAVTAHLSTAPTHRHLLCFETDPDTSELWRTFLEQNMPSLKFTVATSRSELTRLLHAPDWVDAVIIGIDTEDAGPLDILRELRSLPREIPAVVVAAVDDNTSAVAAIKLGAHDYLLEQPGYLPELAFSLNAALRQADLARSNRHLLEELERLNQSLEVKVAKRTSELMAQIEVRKVAESRLAALSSRLLRVQEEERRSTARELHDQIGQTLTGLKLQLEQVQQQVTGPSAAVTEALAVTQTLLDDVRSLTQQLRPQILDDLGLQPALEWHLNGYLRQTGINVALDVSLPAERLRPELELVVFRMVQETLTNVARHAGVKTANLTVAADTERLQVEIADRGCGFDVAAALASHNSIGLAGINERVNLAGGRFEIVSQPGRGTRVNAEFDLNPPTP